MPDIELYVEISLFQNNLMFGYIGRIRWYISENNRTCSDNNIIADVNRTEDDRASADIDVVADNSSFLFCCLLPDSNI